MNGSPPLPNTRVQRSPLGGQWVSVTIVAFGVLVIACRLHDSPPTPVVVRDAGYLVLRPLSWKEDQDHSERVSVKYTSVGYAFAANQPLLDMNAFVLGAARVDSHKDSMGMVTLWLPLNRAGTQALAAWSARNVGEHLGIFIDGKLVQAAGIKSELTLPEIPIPFGDSDEARAVRERLKKGGTSG
jgi:hypothetical protein